ncbi:hypothetical protein D9Q98_005606 [Chlorella vulgaris]|uniref:RBR-type E3 ubiquitin transferase n=1 Tax=Chlorella vulgaris TaxID=3077 RepID=A0A9D4YW08_CHLVU|nr:hypothetical protein D9Q98_005606 [Chlorella vulgaris]
MADIADEVTAVQVALEQAQSNLADFELARGLQRHEFYGSGACGDGSGLDSSGGSEAGDELSEVKLAMEFEVLQLTEQLQQLQDQQLARDLQRSLLEEASRQALDHRLAASIGDHEKEGPSSAAVNALGQSMAACTLSDSIQLRLAFEAEMEGSDSGRAGCGAAISSPAGDVMWEGSAVLNHASLETARLTSCVLGLEAATSLGLGSSITLQLEHGSAAVLTKLTAQAGSPSSSSNGPLIEQAQQMLGRFTVCSANRVSTDSKEVQRAAQLARAALRPAPHSHHEAAGLKGRTTDQEGDQRPTRDDSCAICLQDVPASQFHVIGGCLHRFCRHCLCSHAQTLIRSRAYPVMCPDPECAEAISSPECILLLAGSADDVSMYKQVEAEASIPDQLRCYCPNPRCSVPFLLEAEPAVDSPVYCPACSTKICAFCGIVWHKGCGCKEYQALPSDFRQPEDVALLHVAQQRRWRRCGGCKHMIERNEGCNHMTCTCGFEFCYICGTPWEKVPGHKSRQRCSCELFDTTPVRDNPGPGPDDGVQPFNLDFARFVVQTLGINDDDIPAHVPPHVRNVYKTEQCMYFVQGNCRRGNLCYFAHGNAEERIAGRAGSRRRR